MKKQNIHNDSFDNGSPDKDDEVTVKKVSPLEENLEENPENTQTPETEPHWQSLYEALSEELKNEKEENLRKMAEMENFRKRLIKEKEDFVKFANEGLLQELLPCLDNLDMSIKHASKEQLEKDPVISGIGFVLKQFLQTLEKQGLEPIGSELDNFDPHLHEAIESKVAEGVESGKIIAVHRKGYKLAGRLLRPALVSVSA